MKYVSAAVLVLIFVACARYSWLPLIAYMVFFQWTAVGNIVRTMDQLLAAMLPFGWSGRRTVSNECGNEMKSGKPCWFCRLLCPVLAWALQEPHCEKEADHV